MGTALTVIAIWFALSIISGILLCARLKANRPEQDELAQFSHRWVERS